MAKRMLIDAAHPEETRVVVLNGSRLDEFDFEASTKKQIKGNIYLAKVTRVEPSLQAAFVEYGGNRHGFLAFSEIHPDYYRIPVADRQAALAAERAAEQAANAREDARERANLHNHSPDDHAPDDDDEHEEADEHEQPDSNGHAESESDQAEHDDEDNGREDDDGPGPERMAHAAPSETIRGPAAEPEAEETTAAESAAPSEKHSYGADSAFERPLAPEPESPANDINASIDVTGDAALSEPPAFERGEDHGGENGNGHASADEPAHLSHVTETAETNGDSIETVGGDEIEEATRPRTRPFRHYKIQEVIKRRQIMLVQVSKEERGNKGAALTTYLSLAGRYCVLMPNTPRGGGVSRKITNNIDRRRLKELMSDLDVPEGMGVIVRTAGSERSKTEIKRDLEYLLRLWDEIRDLTLKSTAPALIYEEGNLIKRSIRDLYARDIEEVVVDGEEGYRTAKGFMKMLMPSHAKRVKLYRDPSVPLFHRFQVEGQIDAIHSPVVQLRSGGYVVINPTEALVAIDVNSGRSTKERNIEETALKTNCEAAEEVARQLRLRDLAGLVVIDFIDMEEYRNRSTVERRLKDSMRFDRARIQLGRISPFGLLELSRQRLRSSLVEASTQPCPHCNGTGVIRSIESTALHVLRAIEEEGMRRRSAEIGVTVPPRVALYVLNQKRAAVQLAESRFGFKVMIDSDDTLVPPAFRLERLRVLTPAEIAALPIFVPPPPEPDEEDEAIADEDEAVAAAPEEAPAEHQDDDEENGSGRGRGRRRRRRGWREDGAEREVQPISAEPVQPLAAIDDEAAEPEAAEASAAPDSQEPQAAAEPGSEADRKRRRRGRRGGRRRRRETGGPERPNGANGEHHEGEDAPDERTLAEEAEEIEVVAAEDAPETETIELVPPSPVHEQASRDVAEAFTAAPASPEAAHGTASVPVSDGNGAASHHPSEPEPASIHYNVPPAHDVGGTPAANPRRGWWRR